MLFLKLLVDIACNSIRCQPEDKIKRGKKGLNYASCTALYLRTVKMNPRLDFFFKSEQKEKKWDPFSLPVYKTILKTVFRPCLQSELENKSQGKSNSVKKIGGLLVKNINQVAKTTKIPICKNKKTYI